VVRPRDDQQTWLVRTLVRWSLAWISSERIRARAGVLNDATYRRERLTKQRLLLSTTPPLATHAPPRRRRSAARAEGVSPLPDQYRIELIERA